MTPAVTAILLAAGRSRRMGSCKQLLPLGAESALERCLGTLFAAGAAGVVVVVSPGADGERVALAAARFPVRVVVNREAEGDMASSIRAGRDRLPAGAEAVLVALCDLPLVRPETVATLVHLHRTAPERILMPTCGGRKGHPLLVPLPVLADLGEGETLREVIGRHRRLVREVEVDDPGILADMDLPQDYLRMLSRLCRDRAF
ncbi:nucleotidyltransferase family protein [Geomonas sp. Red32]|uniref:nucleotidyltransferase family protein n=1 Tax=Geomonas sp. Red32 TaxID=2912856 RepID=UPI00202CD9F2|nr:nucleotidyltransferase family protein [Geomonas sp. Red32]MCM0082918.1 nucleotidyltransferase family protein [Geomonas sp. Red32]